MLKNLLVAASLLVMSMASQGALIEHNGYKRESGSTIVKGGGLEWLMWDQTKDLSIQQALDKYSKDGWQLASNQNMAKLFTAFSFGRTSWYAWESSREEVYKVWGAGELSAHNAFIEMFGATRDATICVFPITKRCTIQNDSDRASFAFYGSDSNKNGWYNFAVVVDDSVEWIRNSWGGGPTSFNNDAYVWLQSDGYGRYTSTTVKSGYGVALTREVATNTSKAVSSPASWSLLGLGLFSLYLRRRLAQRR
jgi:hypothetical protein